MSDPGAALRALQARAESDPALRAELAADPLAVVARETGIPVAELNELMSETELAAIAGGEAPVRPKGTPIRYSCRMCTFNTASLAEIKAHVLQHPPADGEFGPHREGSYFTY